MGGKNSGKYIDELMYKRVFDLLEGSPLTMEEIREVTGLKYRTAYRYIHRIEDREGMSVARTIKEGRYFIVKG